MADHGSVVRAASSSSPDGELSNDKTHFVCLFPEDTTSPLLERYLGSCSSSKMAYAHPDSGSESS